MYGLKPSRRMSVIEKLGMFVYTLALGASNREVQERFQHSGETVSRNFNEVLRSVCLLATHIIRPVDPEFTTTPLEIAMNPRYMPYFKNCIGAIDGTHVVLMIQEYFMRRLEIQTYNFRGHRKGSIILLIRDIRMSTVTWVHIEGKDIIFQNFVDEDNPEVERNYLTESIHHYDVKIVVASMALHNYIRRKSRQDVAFNNFDNHPDFVPQDIFPDVVPQSQTSSHQRASGMDDIRDGIANCLMGQ
ncbi:uncharacterized protein [Populus alba]|uniref:uncharacterized protein n=1 Tax=Populus alba TaxID=43335 RepID=UPI003CC71202